MDEEEGDVGSARKENEEQQERRSGCRREQIQERSCSRRGSTERGKVFIPASETRGDGGRGDCECGELPPTGMPCRVNVLYDVDSDEQGS